MDNDHQLSNFPTAGLVQNQHDFVVTIIIAQMIYHGKGSTILSSGHMEAYMIKADASW